MKCMRTQKSNFGPHAGMPVEQYDEERLCCICSGTSESSCSLRASGMPTPTLTTACALSISSIARNAITRRTDSASGVRLAHGALSAPDSVASITGLAKLCQCRSGGATTTCLRGAASQRKGIA